MSFIIILYSSISPLCFRSLSISKYDQGQFPDFTKERNIRPTKANEVKELKRKEIKQRNIYFIIVVTRHSFNPKLRCTIMIVIMNEDDRPRHQSHNEIKRQHISVSITVQSSNVQQRLVIGELLLKHICLFSVSIFFSTWLKQVK